MEKLDTSTRSASVLLVGTEQMLLYTRRAILEKQNLAVADAEPEAAVTLLRGRDYDIIISCHTLAEDELDRVASAARGKDRVPHLIRFTKQPSTDPAPFDTAVWSLAAPETLVEQVFSALASKEN